MLGKSIRLVVLSTVVYLCFSGGPLYGQDCPFPDSVAVTDTLAAEGYFPLHVGDTWEYKVTDSGLIDEFRRTRVESDTLIEGLIFHKAILTRFNWNAEQSAIDRIKSTRSTYIRTTETGLMFWSPGQGFSEQLKGFDRPFNSCFTDSTREAGDTLVIVGGGYDRTFSVVEEGSDVEYTASAIKDVGGFFGSQSFAHGVGEIRGSAEVNVTIALLFAMVDSLEIGTRIDSMYQVTVGSEGLPAGTAVTDRALIQVYPNPGRAIGQIQIDLREAGYASVRFFDLLGRVVSVPLTTSFLTAGRSVHPLDAHDLAPGLYFVTLEREGIVLSTTKYILIQ